jgi:predicted dehydrogenase
VIRAAIVGVGRWGQNLVECTQGKSDKIRFTTGVARTRERAASFASRYGLALVNDYAKALADPASTLSCSRRRTRSMPNR